MIGEGVPKRKQGQREKNHRKHSKIVLIHLAGQTGRIYASLSLVTRCRSHGGFLRCGFL
jgi:hypothetical protein